KRCRTECAVFFHFQVDRSRWTFPSDAMVRTAEKENEKMHILFWIIVGIIAGALAKMVVPGEGPGGILGDLIIGILGAIVGGWVFSFFGSPGAGAASNYSIIWSTLV